MTGDMKTISLSQVDAPTLAEFEVSHSAVPSDSCACACANIPQYCSCQMFFITSYFARAAYVVHG